MLVWTLILLACGFLSVAGFVMHRGFVTGRHRWHARWYFDRTLPVYRRNLPFIMLPGGWMFLTWFVLLAVSRFHGQWWADLAMLPLLLLSFGLFGWAVKRAFWPPESARPDWLRQEG